MPKVSSLMSGADLFVNRHCFIEQVFSTQVCLVSEAFEHDIDQVVLHEQLDRRLKVDAVLHVDEKVKQVLV